MDFYGRETELEVLKAAAKLSQTTSQFTVVLGRRRVGKTTLMLKGAEGTKSVYLFVSRKSESVLCADLQRTVDAPFHSRTYHRHDRRVPESRICGRLHFR